MSAKRQLAASVAPTAAAAEEGNKSMATLMSLLRATMSEENAAGGAAATGEEKVEWLRSQLIGKDVEFDTPFGRRALTYADQTASGRSLRYIEDYLVKEVLPFYGEHEMMIELHASHGFDLFAHHKLIC